MIKYNYHTHTKFSDGKNTPEEMIKAAIAIGFDSIGISDHSVTAFDLSWCILPDRQEEYVKTVLDLKEKYAGRIKVYCGLEQDHCSSPPPDGVEYLIGSVHWLKTGEAYLPLDESRDKLLAGIRDVFDGDADALAEEYYRCVGSFADNPAVSVIGHFDLITKFDRFEPIFRSTERYTQAWQSAAKRLIDAGKIFEINTGAIARGVRSEPYPAEDILKFLGENGAKAIISSDAHAADTMDYAFDMAENLAKKYRVNLVDLF